MGPASLFPCAGRLLEGFQGVLRMPQDATIASVHYWCPRCTIESSYQARAGHWRVTGGSGTVGTITRIVRHELASVGKPRNYTIPNSMPLDQPSINSVPMAKGLGESTRCNLHKAYPLSPMTTLLTIRPQASRGTRRPCLLIHKTRKFRNLQTHSPDTEFPFSIPCHRRFG